MFSPSQHPSRTTYSDCPACGYKQALSVTVKDGNSLYHCHGGCTQDELWRVIGGKEPQQYQPTPEPRQRVANESAKAYALDLWHSSLSGHDGLVPVYLASRGLVGLVPGAIRFLPDHPHKPSGTRWPVMLSGITDAAGTIQAVHRTYLARDGKGKAPVEPAKMTLGAVGGFAVHLGEVGEKLIVAEGIETALSVQQSTGIPAWSAISAGGMRQLILPPLPLASEIIIAADADSVGIKSAQDAAARWRREGRTVRIAMPPDGKDFNDVLQEAAQ